MKAFHTLEKNSVLVINLSSERLQSLFWDHVLWYYHHHYYRNYYPCWRRSRRRCRRRRNCFFLSIKKLHGGKLYVNPKSIYSNSNIQWISSLSFLSTVQGMFSLVSKTKEWSLNFVSTFFDSCFGNFQTHSSERSLWKTNARWKTLKKQKLEFSFVSLSLSLATGRNPIIRFVWFEWSLRLFTKWIPSIRSIPWVTEM